MLFLKYGAAAAAAVVVDAVNKAVAQAREDTQLKHVQFRLGNKSEYVQPAQDVVARVLAVLTDVVLLFVHSAVAAKAHGKPKYAAAVAQVSLLDVIILEIVTVVVRNVSAVAADLQIQTFV